MGGLTATLFPEAQASGEQAATLPPVPPSAGHFRFGRLVASVRTNDAAFGRRFARIFQDCAEPESHEPPASELSVMVSPASGTVEARITGHRELDGRAAGALLPGVEVECRGERLRVPIEAAWPIFLAHYFVHHVMQLQREIVFLHGAIVGVRGRGVFMAGEKGAGKSTLALALGSRGHPVFADEVAAIRTGDLACLPFRRAVSVREGPQASAVRAALGCAEAERLADGTTRRRLALSQLFPGPAPQAVPLGAAVFLRGFGDECEIEAFDFSSGHAGWLGPLLATFSGRHAGQAALELAALFSRVRCYRVRIAGTPDEMAQRIEAIVEDGGC